MEKVRKAFYVEEELLGQVDALLPQADVRSRNEFVKKKSGSSDKICVQSCMNGCIFSSIFQISPLGPLP